MDDVQKNLLEAIDIVVEEKLNNSPFDSTVNGKILSITDNICTVNIDDGEFTAYIMDGINVAVGDIVEIKIIKNNFSNKVVTGKLGTIGNPSDITVDWSNLTNKPSSSAANIDKAVTNSHINYIHTQSVASTTWNIVHNLNRYPNVTIVDSGGNVVMGKIKYISENEIQTIFSAEFGGKAYLN